MVASNRCMVGLVAATDAKPRQARPQLASPDEPETSGALNASFVAANGARFSWTLDDNCFWQSALAELARVLTERLDVNFVYADYDIIDEHGRTVKHIRAQDPLGLLSARTTILCFLYRRAVADHLGGYAEDLTLAEDYDFWLWPLLSEHWMTTLHLPLYEYRQHTGSLTDRHRGRTFAAAERALLRNLPHVTAAYPALRGQVYLTLASLASWRGDLPRSAWYALQAARHAPVQLAAQSVAYAGRRMRRIVT